MNVLITSASAKLSLINAFKQACSDIGGKVITVDSNPDCEAAKDKDCFKLVPNQTTQRYIEGLIDICTANDISLIIPTRDGELRQLSMHRYEFIKHGITIPLPSLSELEVVQDKQLFHAFCVENKFPVLPTVVASENAPWPLFIRLKSGAGGMYADIVKNWCEWQRRLVDINDIICQQVCLDDEYSIDVLLDLEGGPVQSVVRKRVKIDKGECIEGLIVKNPRLEALSIELCCALGLRGHNIVQAFCNEVGDIHFIEVNARFGGASMMSVLAGLNSPARLLQMVRHQNGLTQADGQMSQNMEISYNMKYSQMPNRLDYCVEET